MLLAEWHQTATALGHQAGLRRPLGHVTDAELRAVLLAGEIELFAKVARLGGWQTNALGVTAEVQT